jgi:hypothetical protein
MKSIDNVITSYEASIESGLPKEKIEILVAFEKLKGYRVRWRRNGWVWLLNRGSFSRFLKAGRPIRRVPKAKVI